VGPRADLDRCKIIRPHRDFFNDNLFANETKYTYDTAPLRQTVV